ncbi:hypothetical protein [Persephonella sp.]|uniref:hypothetical protein n=1 Tax=Persephonella sp. TaxID=2060922 RepID=UPI0026086618|nr:hypothetical protein [Persephonella sp.]
MSHFRLERFYPTKLEITITPQQLISMFPIEVQEHPTMGLISRIWKSEDKIFSVDTLPSEDVEDLTTTKKYLKAKDSKMLEILQNLDGFEIVLYYEDKEDIYKVTKL